MMIVLGLKSSIKVDTLNRTIIQSMICAENFSVIHTMTCLHEDHPDVKILTRLPSSAT